MRKKRIALCLVLVMLCCAAAFTYGTAGQYKTTRLFLDYLDREGVPYTYDGISGSNAYEKVTVERPAAGMGTVTLVFIFDPDGETASIRIWNFIDYDASAYARVAAACDSMNGSYRFTCFYTDSSDDSVTVSMDLLLLGTADTGRILYRAMENMVTIAELAYPELKQYAR